MASLPADMEGSWKRWKEWFDHEQPETEPLPQEYKRLPGFEQVVAPHRPLALRTLHPPCTCSSLPCAHLSAPLLAASHHPPPPHPAQLLIIRALRPDRMMLAMREWVKAEIGAKYVDAIPFDLEVSFEDASPATPVFFLLSPGVDPVVAVEKLGKTRDPPMCEADGSFVSVSLGQGQEPIIA
jgi:dynein heavy chain